jgi:wobble nucleotide-excising tRNase
MAITKITRMRDYIVFKDFSWPHDLPEFGRYNLIYGWNGTGKTALSRLFRALETRSAPPNGQVTVTIDGRDVSNGDFAQATLPVRVFNRDFVAESVFPTEGDVTPIFVLGKENVEKQKQVAQLKKTLAEEQIKLATNRQKKEDAENVFSSFCTDKAGVIRDLLRSSGTNPYNNYDKRNFKSRIEEMDKARNRQSYEISDKVREKLLTQLRGSPKSKLQSLTYRLPDLKTLEKKSTDLLSTTVVSEAIQSLKDDAELSSWVHTGLGLHQKKDAKTCLFCDQTMPKDRLDALEAHFNTEYEYLLQKLSNEVTGIQAAIKTATDLAIPKSIELYDDLLLEFELAADALRDELDSAKFFLEALIKALEDKKSRAFQRIVFDVTMPDLDAVLVDNLNGVIWKHNQACDDFESRIDSARKKLEGDSVATVLDEFVKLRGAVQTTEGEVKKAVDENKRFTDEITKLEVEIVKHRQPAEELNEDLRDYLGHGELRLEVKDTGYTIMRRDTPAEFLSEGEITAIALLYFLKSLQDWRFELAKGVVVLDDPVSSLNQNALFTAFGFIRAKTQGVAQLFVFTHNFTFFRLIREWFRNLRGPDKRAWQVYMLECTQQSSGRIANLRKIDSLLMDYETEYHYLFSCVYRLSTDTTKSNLEKYYCAPNIARRLLETFLAFRVPGPRSRSLWGQMRIIEFDEGKRARIYRFLQTHSHRDTIGEGDEDLSLLTESRSVLNDLLAFMRAADEDHVSAMEKLAVPPTDEGRDE